MTTKLLVVLLHVLLQLNLSIHTVRFNQHLDCPTNTPFQRLYIFRRNMLACASESYILYLMHAPQPWHACLLQQLSQRLCAPVLCKFEKDATTPLTHHHAFPSAFSALAPSLPLGSTQKSSARPATALSSAGTELRCRAATRLGGESVSGRARRIATALRQTQPDREGAELQPEAVVTSSQPISFDSHGKKSLSLSLSLSFFLSLSLSVY